MLPVLACALFRAWWRSHIDCAGAEPRRTAHAGNRQPTELRTAIVFAPCGGVLLVAAWVHDKAGAAGLYGVALVSGLTDVDAITLSSLRLFRLDSLVGSQAVTSIALAFMANIAFKLGLIGAAGGMDLLRRCLPALAVTAAGAAVGVFFFA
jgi:uncharacterized membrane protein (DUF4010 family)